MTWHRQISPLEGEMSPKATEGAAARGTPTPFAITDRVGDLCETTPSGLPAISPSRGETAQATALAAARPALRPEKMQPPRKVPSSAA
ncbi:hypothetical protein EOA29_05100 [Mesorhizobium sp. M1E.F.Ca.ET.063.01.1.1]|nr:hypothetical protein EOA29_05100 [Mesorhizobium sp. M1E.F.Ca.ET.063.01.1.1]